MQAPDPIEAVLARLMPPAMSQNCQEEIDEMIDELAAAAPENVVAISPTRWFARCMIGGGIAASIGALIAVFPLTGGSPSKKPFASSTAIDRDLVLVQQAQLIEALQRSKPGEEIVISGIKDGKPLEMRLKVGDGRIPPKALSEEMAESAILEGAPRALTGVINVAKKSASLTANDGIAVVWRDGESYGVKISNFKSEATFERSISPNESLDIVPATWRDQVEELRRSLDQALERGATPPREPRPRVDPLNPSKS